MCTVTLEYNPNNALARRKLAALLATGLFFRVGRKSKAKETVAESPCVFENEVDELLTMFNTDQISQEDVDRECELVREELYDAR